MRIHENEQLMYSHLWELSSARCYAPLIARYNISMRASVATDNTRLQWKKGINIIFYMEGFKYEEHKIL